MRILSWMQNKLNGKQENRRSNGGGSVNTLNNHQNLQKLSKEEFSDWPHGLLAIGTFGNKEIQQEAEEIREPEEIPSSSEDQLDFTPEEVGKLRKELTKLLSQKPTHDSKTGENNSSNILPLDKFLNCPSSLEVDRTICNALCEELEEKDGGSTVLEHSNSVVLSKGNKDIYVDGNKKAAISKRSISFLLKKMFVCRSGFAPAPSLRDPIPETRMEKLLRAIIHKNMYQQKTAPKSTRKYLDNRHSSKTEDHTVDQQEERRNSGCKWVKTDSEYIVLEI
ncbi:hypothetical protein Syun_026607 [Stephania yunnanensis]|uniref:Uncharacterized protein n=1 Tax=Stephania yunnanensis TaxID=152371 RepID=A0AAP0EWP7_9MAGN